jgi:histidinol-phosphate aminotransferase
LYGLAGLRVGYGIARQDIIEILRRTQSPFHIGRLPLLAAMAALDDHEHIAQSKQINSAGKQYLYRCFDEMGLQYLPTEANYILLINPPHDTRAIDAGMIRRGVIIRPATPFGLRDAIRITIGPAPANEKMIAALRETLAELNRGRA